MEQWKKTPWGLVPSTWKISTIKEETSLVTDYVANGSFASLAENVKYTSIEDYAVLIRLVDFNNNFQGPFIFINKSAYDFLAKSKLYGNEIIISNVGANVGTVFKCPKLKWKMSLAPNSIIVKFRGNNDFYYYWLKSKFGQHMLNSIVTGSAQPKFNKTNFRDLAIPVPPIEEQKQIATILSSLDDKIELNRRINRNLEQQAQALFKAWFVDFEPFKDGKFVDSELGKIPEGWKVGNLLDIAIVFDSLRKPLSSRERNAMAKIYPYYGATSLMDYVEDFIFDGTYLLMGEDGSVVNENGHPYLQYVFGRFWVNNHAHVLQGKNGYTTEMLHCLLYKKNISSIVTGAVQAKISQTNMKKILVVIPTKDICTNFSNLIAPIYAKVRNIESENSKLSKIRDTLLPRLMSGELNVNTITE